MARIALRTIVLGLSISGAALGQTRGDSPKVLPYRDGEPIPAGYELHARPRWGLVITGAAMAGAAYGFAVMGAIDTKFKDQGGFLLIPGVGPWLTLAAGGAVDKGCPANSSTCVPEDNGTKRFVLGFDGLLQAAGAIMVSTGLVFPRRRLERSDVTVSLLPAALGQGGYGAFVVGAF